jgi:hypothetical protein
MQDYQLRVIEEKRELDMKSSLLHAFLYAHKSIGLDAAERRRMELQLSAMALYSHCLGERIAHFAEA